MNRTSDTHVALRSTCTTSINDYTIIVFAIPPRIDVFLSGYKYYGWVHSRPPVSTMPIKVAPTTMENFKIKHRVLDVFYDSSKELSEIPTLINFDACVVLSLLGCFSQESRLEVFFSCAMLPVVLGMCLKEKAVEPNDTENAKSVKAEINDGITRIGILLHNCFNARLAGSPLSGILSKQDVARSLSGILC